MSTVTNLDLLNQLKIIKESYEDKFNKLNKYVVGRCVHFEQQNNILYAESKELKDAFEALTVKYYNICEEVSITKSELNELKVKMNLDNSNNVVMESEIDLSKTTIEQTSFMKATIDEIYDEVHTTKQEINNIKQNNMCNDVVITGIPESVNENLLSVVNESLIQYHMSIKEADVKQIYRLKNKCSGINAPVLMVFRDEKIKSLILQNQKKLGPILLRSFVDKIPESDFRKIIFKHRVTKENLQLLRETRKFGREMDYKYVWTYNNGNVFIKKTNDSCAISISSLKELELLRN